MTLAEKYKTLWTESVHKNASEITNSTEYLATLMGATGACIIGLATEIDLLRSELVAKGLLESA
jgi:hypothetical protein